MSAASSSLLHPLSHLASQYEGRRLPQMPDNLATWWKEAPTIVKGSGNPDSLWGLKLPEKVPLSPPEKGRAIWDRGRTILMPRLAFPALILGVIFTLVGASATITILSGVELPGMELVLKYIPLSLAFSLSILKGGLHSINSGILAARKDNRFRQENNLVYQKLRIEEATGVFYNKEDEREKQSLEVLRMNKTLVNSLGLSKTLIPRDLYAKANSDVNFSITDEHLARVQAILRTPRPLEPPVNPSSGSEPDKIEVRAPIRPAQPLSFLNRVHEFFYEKQTTLGVIDIIVGQLMLFAGFVGIISLFFPNIVPTGLEAIIKDPGLSLPASFILLGHWINCTRTGWRMLDFHKREIKRAKLEKEVQLISLGLDKCRIETYCFWLQTELSKLADRPGQDPNLSAQFRSQIAAINEVQNSFNKYASQFDPEIRNMPVNQNPNNKDPKSKEANQKNAEQELKGILAPTFARLGNTVVPALATPSILIGCILTFMGLAFLGMAISGAVPPAFAILAENTSLSIIFATTLLIAGFNGIYRGASLSDFDDKQTQKKYGSKLRGELLKALFLEPKNDAQRAELRTAQIRTHFMAIKSEDQIGNDQVQNEAQAADIARVKQEQEVVKSHLLEKIPVLSSPTVSASSASKPKTMPVSVDTENRKDSKSKSNKEVQEVQSALKALVDRKGWYGFWIKSTESRIFWGSQLALGSFLLIVSVVGLLMVAGIHKPPPFFDFIASEPSASTAFFFSTLAISVDTLSGFYRTKTYKGRKIEDKEAEVKVIEKCYETLFPSFATSIIKV